MLDCGYGVDCFGKIFDGWEFGGDFTCDWRYYFVSFFFPFFLNEGMGWDGWMDGTVVTHELTKRSRYSYVMQMQGRK